ncbi:MAG: c-type cytochrome [Planctomycetes bacterium]|nr:c-type cytochrome [Planctomycetota bacterium]
MWIWAPGQPGAGQKANFRKVVVLDDRPKQAMFVGSCDNSMKVLVNGKSVGSSGEWGDPLVADITRNLHAGDNVIAIAAENTDGPAGLIARIAIMPASGDAITLVTDASWKVGAEMPAGWTGAKFDDVSWPAAAVVAKLGDGPWTAINDQTLTFVAPQQPTATPPDRIHLRVPGFKVELLYSVPKAEQGSWVNMAVDPKGRLIVSDQYGMLYRVTPPAIGSDADVKIEPLDLKFKDENGKETPIGGAQGIVCAFDSLYFVASDKNQGLYRAQDTDGDDMYDKVTKLRSIPGGGEHGPHAVILGPDNKLYVEAGNHTKIPDPDESRVPRIWGEDHLLPRMWDANGHARGILAPGGWVCRTDAEGKSWELFCSGFRNEFDIAFNREGELFTYDADMEWDMNTPWYRPTRVCHVVSGGEFGWRSGTGKWPTYYPDSLPPVVEIGPGSPTGVTFGYGAKFPAEYQKAFFICDWSYGKLYTVKMTPDGSTYDGKLEEFMSAAPLPLTDIVVNPRDGAMYITVGGRRVQSGLYRLTYVGDESTAPAPADDAGADQRAIRHRLEAFHGHQDAKAVDTAWPYLASKDRFLRYAARTAIEWQPAGQWASRALAEKNPQALIEAMVALARAGDKSLQPKLIEALGRLEWSNLDIDQQLATLRAYALVFTRMGDPSDDLRKTVIDRLDPLYPATDPRLNAELSLILIYLEAPDAATKTMDLLAKAPTQEEQLRYALWLRNLKTGWTMDQRKAYFTWFQKAAHYKGGNSFAKFIINIKNDAIANLSQAEKTELKPIIEGEIKSDAPTAPVAPRQFVKNWTIDELAPIVDKEVHGRDFNHGRELFGAVGCFNCHRFAGEGGSYGPDLTGVSGRFSSRDLLESIIEPSKTISDQYQSTIFTLNNGQVVMGRIVNLGGDGYSVSVNMLDPNQLVRVESRDIKSMQPSPISMMPPGLLSTLNKDEALDLLAYLLSRGDPNSDIFKK